MLQISFAKPTWATWFPFPYFYFEGIYGSAFFYGLRYNRPYILVLNTS